MTCLEQTGQLDPDQSSLHECLHDNVYMYAWVPCMHIEQQLPDNPGQSVCKIAATGPAYNYPDV